RGAASDGGSRIPALEIMTGTSTVAQCISEGRTHDLLKAIEQGSYYGMQSFDQALVKLQAEGKITLEEARRNATSVHGLELKMKGFAHETPGGS
ncbi:MAG: twitching motility protein PilT, partial [bacterium]